MSEVESEVRQMLRSKAAELSGDVPPSTFPRTRIRARRALNLVTATVVVAGIAVGAYSIGDVLRRDAVVPVGPSPRIGATYGIPGEPTDVVFGFGSVWIATEDAVLRIDPTSGAVQARIDGFPGNARPKASGITVNRVTVGAGAVWVVIVDDGYRSSFTTMPSASATAGVGSIGGTVTPPPAGFVPKWGVVRIDPASNAVEDSGLLNGSLPSAIVATADEVWVTARRIGRQGVEGLLAKFDFDPKTKTNTLYDLPGEPAAVVADLDGLWVGIRGRNRILKIDPRTARQVAGAAVANPGDMILRGDEIWVSSIKSGKWNVERFEKETLAPRAGFSIGAAPEWESEMIEAGGRAWFVSTLESDPFAGVLSWIEPSANAVSGSASVEAFSRQITAGEGVLWMLGGATGDAKLYRVDLPDRLR